MYRSLNAAAVDVIFKISHIQFSSITFSLASIIRSECRADRRDVRLLTFGFKCLNTFALLEYCIVQRNILNVFIDN